MCAQAHIVCRVLNSSLQITIVYKEYKKSNYVSIKGRPLELIAHTQEVKTIAAAINYG